MKRTPKCLNRRETSITSKRRWWNLSISLLLTLGCLVVNSIPAVADDLQTTYQLAVSTSPLIARARAQLAADLAGKPLARAALLPHVSAGASGGMNTAQITGFGAQTISTGYHSDTFSASLTESIFDGQDFTAVKQADSRVQASEAALAYVQQVVALEVTQAYFGVLQAQANHRVAQQQMELLQSIDSQARESLRVGSGDIISVQEVQAQLDAAKATLISANNAVTVARNQLERLTHHAVGTLQDVTYLQPTGPQPDTLDPWLEAALKNQPLLLQAKTTLKVSEQQVEFARRARWPTLTLSGIGQHAAGSIIAPVTINQIGASLNLSIPIYQGGSIRAGIHQAQALSEVSRADVASIQDQIIVDTQVAFHNLQDSVSQFEAAQQAVTSARVSLDGTRVGYEIGSRSIIDLLTATTNYTTAQRDYYLALYAQLVVRTQLKTAAGILTPLDIEAINTLLYQSPAK